MKDGELEIDKEGRIWRLKIRRGKKNGGFVIIDIPRKRVEKKIPAGYLMVRVMWDNKRVCGLAHRLVWQYFFGDIPLGMCINHKDGIKNNNNPTNLEISTYSENMKHAYRTGLTEEYGERNPAAKLSNNDVELIRKAYSSGDMTQVEIGEQFNVSHKTISKIIRGDRRPKQDGPMSKNNPRWIESKRKRKKNGQFGSKA